ncbi:NAD/NADP octopine/nopaline dehydrogenase family protein [Psychrilyobacter atlanticus]|uniref:NAD/NADP octopine/nopaline dehydrogenase family protein n=1 Tax=Psychrilyobacter atlanticus TaxID=271091 RepID=UPI000419EEC6|nr:NAD/NADP-dependent octopine/nopaline dehydrogenase family protein [Psychrilyobacter atlanticus]
MKKITIVGGGSSAHIVAPLLANSGFRVTILTSKPDLWKKTLKVEFQSKNGEVKKIVEGKIHLATSNEKTALKDAEIILLCMPVSQYFKVLLRIGEYIPKDKEVWLGSIYGQGGFNWMCNEIKEKFSLDKLVYFSYGLIPWICRTKEYGSTGITYGAKYINIVSVFPKDKFNELNNDLFKKISLEGYETSKTCQADNFLSLTLSVDNQIIHTSRMYGLYLKNKQGWKTLDEVPYFYREFDESSADILKRLDADYDKVRQKIKIQNPTEPFDYMLNYLDLERFTNNSSNENIKESFVNSKTLGQIKTPVMKEGEKYILDKNSRFFTDDIFYGIAIVKWLADKYKIAVPMINELLNWSQSYLNLDLLKNDVLNTEYEYNGIKVGIPTKYKTYKGIDLIK